ncbi:MAG: hypothetical protein ABI405_04800 [Parafilimonas sp.]
MRFALLIISLLFSSYCFSQTAKNIDQTKDSIVYHFEVRLTKALGLTPNCGYMAFALLQKFEVIKTDFPNYTNRFVLIVEPCPEFLGIGFFQNNKIYQVSATLNSTAPFSYPYPNKYEKDNLPIFWSKEITKLK